MGFVFITNNKKSKIQNDLEYYVNYYLKIDESKSILFNYLNENLFEDGKYNYGFLKEKGYEIDGNVYQGIDNSLNIINSIIISSENFDLNIYDEINIDHSIIFILKTQNFKNNVQINIYNKSLFIYLDFYQWINDFSLYINNSYVTLSKKVINKLNENYVIENSIISFFAFDNDEYFLNQKGKKILEYNCIKNSYYDCFFFFFV
ncbi:MAG: hypothetical protein TYPL_5120 [Candidatus Tyloplasma litorale]|nr:MAG: hypothetical protein TYPL_5120 [Mycoplasmatales bacterium]